jgi:LemA protein
MDKKIKKYIVLGAVGLVVLLLLGGGCSTYNSLVNLDEEVNNQWANVQTQYQRRLDLIPNLVNTVKGYAAHESSTLQSVTDARVGLKKAYDQAKEANSADQPADVEQYQQAQDNLNKQLSVYVNAVHEAYPDLKANENFLNLQTQLEGTENRIATERTRYNQAVKDYNVKRRRFPNNIFSGIFGFDARKEFQADAAAQSAPTVSFDGSSTPEVDF